MLLMPVNDEKTTQRGTFAETRIGFVHVYRGGQCLAEGELIVFLAIDHVSKFT